MLFMTVVCVSLPESQYARPSQYDQNPYATRSPMPGGQYMGYGPGSAGHSPYSTMDRPGAVRLFMYLVDIDVGYLCRIGFLILVVTVCWMVSVE